MTTMLRQRRRRNRGASGTLVILAGGLAVVGSLVGLAATVEAAVAAGRSPVGVAAHELLWLAIAGGSGVIAHVVVRRLGLERVLVAAPVLLGGALLFLAVVMLPGVGTTVGGASRWLVVGPFQLQPSEFAKLALVLYLARVTTTRPRTHVAGPVLVVTAIVAGAIFVEPDMGTALVVGAIGLGALVLARVPWRQWVTVTAAAAVVVVAGALSSPYRRARLLSFLHPWQFRESLAYQEVQALAAFASAHVTGSGLGAGLANWGYVPNAVTDFVMTLVVQDFGVVGAIGVVAALGGLILGLLVLAERAGQPSSHVVTALTAVWFAAQSILNLGAVVGLLPVTGVPLPFVSQGGSSLVVVSMALGVCLAAHSPRRSE